MVVSKLDLAISRSKNKGSSTYKQIKQINITKKTIGSKDEILS